MSTHNRRISKHRAKPPGACIFCGTGSLSREHIWPQWAEDLLPKSPGAVLTRWNAPLSWQGAPPQSYQRNLQGALKNHRLRVVCRSCNSGWMSALEQAVRATLTDLILGQACVVAEPAQRTLREWLTLKLMVAEHSNPTDAVFTANERVAFFNYRDIPEVLKIWLFDCGASPWDSAYYRSSFTLFKVAPAAISTRHAKNVAGVTLGIGRLLVAGVYDRPGVMNVAAGSGGRQLWPMGHEALEWPPLRRLSDADALRIAQTVERFGRHPNIQVVEVVPE